MLFCLFVFVGFFVFFVLFCLFVCLCFLFSLPAMICWPPSTYPVTSPSHSCVESFARLCSASESAFSHLSSSDPSLCLLCSSFLTCRSLSSLFSLLSSLSSPLASPCPLMLPLPLSSHFPPLSSLLFHSLLTFLSPPGSRGRKKPRTLRKIAQSVTFVVVFFFFCFLCFRFLSFISFSLSSLRPLFSSSATRYTMQPLAAMRAQSSEFSGPKICDRGGL